LGAVVPVAVDEDADATPSQCAKVFFVIEFPPTCTTASPGMPPHADSATAANKTAPSAGTKRNPLDTTRAL
jgi:hypothetical protein